MLCAICPVGASTISGWKVRPVAATGYHTQADRGTGLVGSNVWNINGPDGVIVVGDIGAVVAQFGHVGCKGK